MKSKSYADKLKDPRWQKRRLHVLESAGWKCEDCGASDLPLHIHHCAYIRGFDPWQYGDDLLMVLCEKHHEERQKLEDGLRVALGRITRRKKLADLDADVWSVIESVQRAERRASHLV